MELSPYIEAIRHDLAAAAAAGSEQAQATAGLLAAALEPAVRLCLVDALSAMAAEVTSALSGPSVEIRMRGRDPQIVVIDAPENDLPVPPLPPPPPLPPGAPPAPGAEEADVELARVTVRLPERLKARADESASSEHLSLNAWIVRVIATAVGEAIGVAGARATRGPGSRRLTGFARS